MPKLKYYRNKQNNNQNNIKPNNKITQKYQEIKNSNDIINQILVGGLGNQLFILFNIIALSKKYNKKFYIQYDKNYQQNYLNQHDTLRKRFSEYKIFKNIKEAEINSENFIQYDEPEFKYNDIILEKNLNYKLNGYFQSYKYFWEYKDDIKNYLFINSEKINSIKNYLKFFEKDTLAIHMRLGDYEKLQNIHAIPSIEYYKKALSCYNLNKYQIILFSDDFKLANDKLKEINIDYIKANEFYENDEDQFLLMSLCNVKICANSSFSLMSCYFNEIYNFVENAEYIFPYEWFGNDGPVYNIDDLIPNKNYKFKIYKKSIDNNKYYLFFNENLIIKFNYENNIDYIKYIKNLYINHNDNYFSLYSKYNIPTICVYVVNYEKNLIYYDNSIKLFDKEHYHFIFFLENIYNFEKLSIFYNIKNFSINYIYEKNFENLILMSKCDNIIIPDSCYAMFSIYLMSEDVNFNTKKKCIPYYWNNDIDIFNLFYIDYNTSIIDNKKKLLIHKNKNLDLEINYFDNFDYENTLFFIAKINNYYYMVNNLLKTKQEINIFTFIEKCKKIVTYLNIYILKNIALENYKDEINNVFFTIFIIGYNCSKWIKTCIESILKQDYSNFELIYLNPASTDNTEEIVTKCCEKYSIKYYIINNNPRKYQTENFFTITKLAKENSILVSVDGDDWLKHNNVLNELNIAYYATNCLLTYGLYEEVPLRYVDKFWTEIPKTILDSNTIRESNMRTSHLRTWIRELLLYVDENDTKYDNKFQKSCGDLSILYPMIEIAGNRIAYIKKENYCYNKTNEISDFKTNCDLQIFLDEYYRNNKNKYKKVDNVWFLINHYLRNIKYNDQKILQKLHLSKYLKPSNLKFALFDEFNDFHIEKIYNNFQTIKSNNNDFIKENFNLLKELFYDIDTYNKVYNIEYLNKDIINYNMSLNFFDTNYIFSKCNYYFIYDKSIYYDWNIIIPYYDRYENLIYLIKNLKEKLNNQLKYIITVVEISNSESLRNNYIGSFNYIFIDKNLLNCFNKTLCGIITYKLYKNNYKYKSILWHDVDCCIQSNFLEMIFEKINEYKNQEICIQTFPYKYVIYTNKILADNIRNNKINIDCINENSKSIENIKPGAPGGSILIPIDIFMKYIYFNTSIFYNYSCEDAFIKYNIEKKNIFESVNYNKNHMIHLWHKKLSNNPIENNKHFYFQESFFKIYRMYN